MYALKKFWLPLCVIGLIFLDNFSTSALIGLVCLVMYMVGRIRWRLLGKVVAGMVGFLAIIILVGLFIPQSAEWGPG